MDNRTQGQTATPGHKSDTATNCQSRLYLLFECERLLASSLTLSLDGRDELCIGRGSQREVLDEERTLRVPDRWLSSKHARLQCSFGRWIFVDEDSKNGSFINGVQVKRQQLQDGDLLELGHTFFLYRESVVEEVASGGEVVDLSAGESAQRPITLNPELAQELVKLDKIAQTDISILLLGESGAGKEVFAQRIHQVSARKGAFIPVNCGALPSGLVESELFGHKKGAFSGAVGDHLGLVRSADMGTLFLDEIADLPVSAQAVMLRVLQEKEVRAVGGTTNHGIDLRTVAATHLDLETLVGEGKFRNDLFARIAGYQLTMPPLRKRREDLGMLMALFLAGFGRTSQQISVAAARALIAYSWPLNIRELRSCLQTAIVLAGDNCVDVSHLPEPVRNNQLGQAEPCGAGGETQNADQRRELKIINLLRENQGNMSAVARAMSKDRKQIQRWIKRYGIDVTVYRDRS